MNEPFEPKYEYVYEQRSPTGPTPPPPSDFDKAPVRKVFSRVGFALALMMAVSIAAQYAVFFLMQLYVSYGPGYLPAWLGDGYTLIMTLVFYAAGVPVFAAVIRKLPKDSRLEHRRLPGKCMFGAISVSITAMLVGGWIAALLMAAINALLPSPVSNPVESLVSQTTWYTVISVCVLAPAAEELVFRKLLLDRISVYGDKLAIVVSGVVFGLFHGNFYQFFYAALLGMVFAWVYLRSGKLILSVLMHALINFMGGVVAPYVQEAIGLDSTDIAGSLDSFSMLSDNLLPVIISMVYTYGLFALAIVGFVQLVSRKRRDRINMAPGIIHVPDRMRFSVSALNPGMIVFLVLSVAYFAVSLFL